MKDRERKNGQRGREKERKIRRGEAVKDRGKEERRREGEGDGKRERDKEEGREKEKEEAKDLNETKEREERNEENYLLFLSFLLAGGRWRSECADRAERFLTRTPFPFRSTPK